MGPPKPPVPHVAPIYRVTATALGAGMWFWAPFCLAGSTPGTTKQLDQVEIRDQGRHGTLPLGHRL
ncbi:hypothetical protein N5P37_008195 [Trichoderma harzianum]|nr:hypothetical protein N5P37_008195 [Trichoderma harzianum]